MVLSTSSQGATTSTKIKNVKTKIQAAKVMNSTNEPHFEQSQTYRIFPVFVFCDTLAVFLVLLANWRAIRNLREFSFYPFGGEVTFSQINHRRVLRNTLSHRSTTFFCQITPEWIVSLWKKSKRVKSMWSMKIRLIKESVMILTNGMEKIQTGLVFERISQYNLVYYRNDAKVYCCR